MRAARRALDVAGPVDRADEREPVACRERAVAREQPLARTPAHEIPASPDPRPSEVVRAEELWEQMVAICPPAHRDVLRLKRQGFPLAEIAARTGLHPGSVRRVLYDLARRMADRERKSG